MEWISVKDRLPEPHKEVQILSGDGDRWNAKRLTQGNDWIIKNGHGNWVRFFDGATHWMPLPAPPEGWEE